MQVVATSRINSVKLGIGHMHSGLRLLYSTIRYHGYHPMDTRGYPRYLW